ncbi:hypothetical protein B296_00046781 [Ensete ventricosum]|uniref:WAT1-related protein n=1 Tax=Ensete ventricosum TaxID=4639 RepID=A0A426XFD4_ENSVE|nr:hypothetical protein B296_00046781 [Ensete ventricosum]
MDPTSGTEPSSPHRVLALLNTHTPSHSLSSSSELSPPPPGMAGCNKLFHKCMPYLAMILLQFGYAGMNIITKVSSLNHGMSHYVLVVYRHFFATLSIAPFALVLERSNELMIVELAGNDRMEKVHLKKVRCQAKVVGTLVTVAGAMMMTLYKGPIMDMCRTKHAHPPHSNAAGDDSTDEDWLKGCIFLIIATLAWASLFILQAATLKKYDAPLSLTSSICSVGILQAIAVTFIVEHKPSVWRIVFDMNLLAAAYAWVEELMEQDEAETEKAKASPVAENSMKAKKEES